MSPLSHNELRKALGWVLANRKAAGLDGVDLGALRGSKKERRLLCDRVHRWLSDGSYHPYGARKGKRRRRGKGPRVHAIASLADAVVLKAVTTRWRYAWDRMPPCLVGGRPGTDIGDTLAEVTCFIQTGGGAMARFDIREAFKSADLRLALAALARYTDAEEDGLFSIAERWVRRQGARFGGLVEGSPFGALLLAAIVATEVVPYLRDLDGSLFIYMDDGLFLSRDRETAEEALRRVRTRLARVGLELHPDKTFIEEIGPRGTTTLDFVGYVFIDGHPYPRATNVDGLSAALTEAAGDGARLAKLAAGWHGFLRVVPPNLLRALDEFLHAELGLAAPPGFCETSASHAPPGLMPIVPGAGDYKVMRANRHDHGTSSSRPSPGRSKDARTGGASGSSPLYGCGGATTRGRLMEGEAEPVQSADTALGQLGSIARAIVKQHPSLREGARGDAMERCLSALDAAIAIRGRPTPRDDERGYRVIRPTPWLEEIVQGFQAVHGLPSFSTALDMLVLDYVSNHLWSDAKYRVVDEEAGQGEARAGAR
jgi:hypothetical protein